MRRRRPRPSSYQRPPDSIRRVPHQRRIGIRWDDYAERLGREPDADIASEIGCSATAVYKARQQRNIKTFVPAGVRFDDLVNRFGRVLRTTTVATAFASRRCARRWLSEDKRLLGRGSTRDRRWLALPKGIEVADVEALPDELLDVLEAAMAAEHDRDLIVAGLDAHEAAAARVIATGVAPTLVDEMPAELVELLDGALATARERDALVAGVAQLGGDIDDVRGEGRAVLADRQDVARKAAERKEAAVSTEVAKLRAQLAEAQGALGRTRKARDAAEAGRERALQDLDTARAAAQDELGRALQDLDATRAKVRALEGGPPAGVWMSASKIAWTVRGRASTVGKVASRLGLRDGGRSDVRVVRTRWRGKPFDRAEYTGEALASILAAVRSGSS